jgi:SAM-dependent methyltransferase
MLFEVYLSPGMAILDLGVGAGRTTPFLSQLASRYVGLDYSKTMIQVCQAKFPHLVFAVADAADLSQFSDSAFDAVIFSFNGVDYLFPDEKPLACFTECRRVLKDHGVFIFSSHNPKALFPKRYHGPTRVRSLAKRMTAKVPTALPAVLAALRCAKFALGLLRTARDSSRRAWRRLPTKAFWRGEGFVLDPTHGGLVTHCAVPSRVIYELTKLRFDIVGIFPEQFPDRDRPFKTRWYYYAFRKRAGWNNVLTSAQKSASSPLGRTQTGVKCRSISIQSFS